MSRYTTGELAKLCHVSVRTVQYYDSRGILVPSELSDGGRRLYTEQDLSKLKIICFLRELELPIDSIKALFAEEHPEQVIDLLFTQQEATLRREIAEKQARATMITEAKKALQQMSRISVASLGDIAVIMENKSKLRRVHRNMLLGGLLLEAVEISTLMLGILRGIWLPYALGTAASIAFSVWISRYYWVNTAYICPDCHTVFRPRFREAFFARHTPNTRRLSCTHCGHYGFCVETYGKEQLPC